MKLKATRRGFDNVKLREEGEIFEMDVEKCPSWCERLDKPAKAAKVTGNGSGPTKSAEK